MTFGEQMVHGVTSIFRCQVIISMLMLSLLPLKRLIISHYQIQICRLSEHREDFWILKLQTFPPQDLNITQLSSRHYWIYLVAILRLITTLLYVHFSLFRTLSRV